MKIQGQRVQNSGTPRQQTADLGCDYVDLARIIKGNGNGPN